MYYSMDINKSLYGFAEQVLDEYEYDGSPIYEYELSKELVAVIIDKVIERSKAASVQAYALMLDYEEATGENWTKGMLLRALLESHVLHDIYAVRRPRYGKLNPYKPKYKSYYDRFSTYYN